MEGRKRRGKGTVPCVQLLKGLVLTLRLKLQPCVVLPASNSFSSAQTERNRKAVSSRCGDHCGKVEQTRFVSSWNGTAVSWFWSETLKRMRWRMCVDTANENVCNKRRGKEVRQHVVLYRLVKKGVCNTFSLH